MQSHIFNYFSFIKVHESRLKKVDEELQAVQELCKILSTYKNQEYPEKLLQIKNLQKEFIDLHNVHAEEKDELVEMINKETNRVSKIQIDSEKTIVQNIYDVRKLSECFGFINKIKTFDLEIK